MLEQKKLRMGTAFTKVGGLVRCLEMFWMLQLGIQTSFCRHLVLYKTLGKLRGAWMY